MSRKVKFILSLITVAICYSLGTITLTLSLSKLSIVGEDPVLRTLSSVGPFPIIIVFLLFLELSKSGSPINPYGSRGKLIAYFTLCAAAFLLLLSLLKYDTTMALLFPVAGMDILLIPLLYIMIAKRNADAVEGESDNINNDLPYDTPTREAAEDNK